MKTSTSRFATAFAHVGDDRQSKNIYESMMKRLYILQLIRFHKDMHIRMYDETIVYITIKSLLPRNLGALHATNGISKFSCITASLVCMWGCHDLKPKLDEPVAHQVPIDLWACWAGTGSVVQRTGWMKSCPLQITRFWRRNFSQQLITMNTIRLNRKWKCRQKLDS